MLLIQSGTVKINQIQLTILINQIIFKKNILIYHIIKSNLILTKPD